jgi:hypothetical protein
MKSLSAGALLVWAVIAAIVVCAAGPVGPPEPADTAALKEQIRALEKRVEVLEERLRQQPPAGAFAIPPATKPTLALPKGWQQRDFNGMPYYLVPAQEAQVAPAQRAR